MAKMVVEDFHKNEIDALDSNTVRSIMKKCLWAGAKVVEKEMQQTIEANHHVVTGSMKNAVAQGDIHEDIDGCYVEIYPQGTDPRGVSNEMKNKIINTGYYNVATGRGIRKKDPYIRKMTKNVAPKVRAVMEYQFKLCMDELTK